MTKTERIQEELQKSQEKLLDSINQILEYEPGREETKQYLHDSLAFYYERVEEDFQSMEGESQKVASNRDYPAHLRAESFKRLVAELKQMESKILFRIGPFEIRRRL